MTLCKVIKALIEHGAKLTVEERNLRSVAYKNTVGARRAGWRTINLDAAIPEVGGVGGCGVAVVHIDICHSGNMLFLQTFWIALVFVVFLHFYISFTNAIINVLCMCLDH